MQHQVQNKPFKPIKPMAQYNTPELCDFLRQWGTEFKKLEGPSNPYYQTCVDAFLGLEGKPLQFFGNKAGVSRALHQLADVMEAEIKKKNIHPDMKYRVEAFHHIAERLLKAQPVQISLFES